MKRIASLFLIPFAIFLAASCEKSGDGGSTSGKAVLGVTVNNLDGLVEIPKNQVRTYELFVTANPGPSDAIKVTLGVEAELVAKYNAANGTAYELLPEAAYELSSEGLILMRYNKKSTLGSLKLMGEGCVEDQTYVLPIVISMVQGTADYETPEDKVAYVLYKMVAPQYDGTGTAEDPYLVKSVENINNIGYMLLDGKYLYFKLAADIDFGGAAWTQVESHGKGIFFDGDGHKISNVKASTGLFTSLEGTVENLVLDNIQIGAGSVYAGVLSNTADIGTVVKNVTVTNSSITNTGCCGGLIGSVIGVEVENVNVDCNVEGKSMVGGVFGRIFTADVKDCTASGNVTSTSYYTGGFVGTFFAGTISNCSASGNVTITGNDIYARAGGFIGEMSGGAVEDCFATGDVAATNYWGGGFIGVISAEDDEVSVKRCYATGDLNFQKTEDQKMAGVGGFIGSVSSGKITVEDCYATGKVHADRWSAGFVGNIYGGTLTIKNGFCTCDLSDLGPCRAKGADGEWNGQYIHEDGIVIGAVFTSETTNTAPVVKCTGFVAWNAYSRQFCYPLGAIPFDGNYYGTEGTVSSQAAALGWSTDVWDLSSDVPALK